MRRRIVNLGKCLTVITIFAVLGSSASTDRAQPVTLGAQAMGTVKGTVMDSNGAAIITPRPSIVFEGKLGVKSVAADDSGDYEITLPAGIYNVTTEIPGFYPFRRASFRVLPGAAVMINLVLTQRYLVRGTTVSARESVDTPVPSPKYNEFHVPGRGVSLVIQFQKKRTANEGLKYDGAVFTYDALTIYADKLSFNKTRLQLKASGKRVVVEDGEGRVQVRQVAVAFKRGQPILNLMK